MDESGRPKAVRAKNILGEHPNGTGKFAQGVMKGHHAPRREVRRKTIEIRLGALVGMVAINPQDANGAIPGGRDVGGVGAMRLDPAGKTSGANEFEKIRVGGSFLKR
jgi:hypothetical protein